MTDLQQLEAWRATNRGQLGRIEAAKFEVALTELILGSDPFQFGPWMVMCVEQRLF